MLMDVTKQVALFDDSKRAVASLMARENIAIQIVDGAPTASFNPVTRVLSLPAWASMTNAQVDTFMAHEVGHALFSDSSLYEKIAKDSKGLFTYLNVVEDARIERKMRDSFPGLARVFHNGYQEFHQRGPVFQGTTDTLVNPRNGEHVALAKMKLIDRINLYYKIGAFCKVPFTAAEQVWIAKIDRCGSMDQALEIARQLHALAKEAKEAATPQPQTPPQDAPQQPQSGDSTEEPSTDETDATASDDSTDASDEGDDAEDAGQASDDDKSAETDELVDENDEKPADEAGDEDGDDAGDETDENSTDEDGGQASDSDDSATTNELVDGEPSDETGTEGAGNAGDDDEVSETDQAAAEALREIAEANGSSTPEIRHLLYGQVSDALFAKRTVSAKAWTESVYAAIADRPNHAANLDKMVTAWEARLLPTAQSMALSFEQRKTAKQLQHAKTSKTGKLDIGKLANYKFSEDLFLRTMSVPNGKSHGVVMVIDASGSMTDCFASVLDQVLLFAHFAFRVQVPFEAYMFTDRGDFGYVYGADHALKADTDLHSIQPANHGGLVGLVNTRTDRASFKRQVRAVCALRHQFSQEVTLDWTESIGSIPYADLGGTPLFTGVMLGEKALSNMKREARLDKTTFVVVTDGQDGGGLRYRGNRVEHGTGRIVSTDHCVGDTAMVVRDLVTKKNFTYVEQTKDYRGIQHASLPTNAVITMLMDIIKARHETRTIYLYLQSGGITVRGGGFYRRGRRRQVTTLNAQIEGMNYMVRSGDQTKINTPVAVEALKNDGQYVLPVGLGVADLAIVLRQSKLAMDEAEFANLDATKLTQRKIAAEFTKSMVKGVANRVFVNTVIPHLI